MCIRDREGIDLVPHHQVPAAAQRFGDAQVAIDDEVGGEAQSEDDDHSRDDEQQEADASQEVDQHAGEAELQELVVVGEHGSRTCLLYTSRCV